MDPQDEVIGEAIVCAVEDFVTLEREKTRRMKVSWRTDLAKLEAKERERSTILRQKDLVLAVTEAGGNFFADFLEAHGNNLNVLDIVLMNDIEALISLDVGDSSRDGCFGDVLGGAINYLENTQKLDDEGAMMATIEGTKGNEK